MPMRPHELGLVVYHVSRLHSLIILPAHFVGVIIEKRMNDMSGPSCKVCLILRGPLIPLTVAVHATFQPSK